MGQTEINKIVFMKYFFHWVSSSTRPVSWQSFNQESRGSDNSAITGGANNYITGADGTSSTYGFIGGGAGNIICNTTCYSSILGGANNTNSGYYSAILGGANNTIPAGCSYAGVFGNGITAVSNDTFHVSCLNTANTPPYSITLLHGAVFFVPVGGTPPPGIRGALYVK